MGKAAGALLVVLMSVGSAACAARAGVPRPFPVATRSPENVPGPIEPVEPPAESTPPEADPASLPEPAPASHRIIQTALEFIGAPYRNGGSDPSGFDCSGFVQYVFARHGALLPREAREQYERGQTIDLEGVRPGDLVFFETVGHGASHVGIALGNGRFIHAPSSRGVVRVEPYTAAYWARRFVGARRLDEDKAGGTNDFPGAIRSSR
jgi:cell wall-associated NlpC family hydrolase